jgi:DNA-directed RNA polymerase subunit RPC12/RpoP
MYKFRSLRCFTCNSVILNLPEAEVTKLQGMNIRCENCGHHNSLSGVELNKALTEKLPLLATYEWEAALDS